MAEELPAWRSALFRYEHGGIRPGSFLSAVLENNLTQAVLRADNDSITQLREIVLHCYANLPSRMWGSKEAVEVHIKARRKEHP